MFRTSRLAALRAIVASLSCAVLLGPLLGSWTHLHDSLEQHSGGSIRVAADPGAPPSLHSDGCEHGREPAPHDADSCVTCRTLQQTRYSIAHQSHRQTLPVTLIALAPPPSRDGARTAHLLQTAPRAPPAIV